MNPSSNSDTAALADKKKGKYLTKVVKFGKENLTLYSLDGNTWSSRRQELSEIANRHEQERLKSIQAMGETAEEEKVEKAEGEESEAAEKDESEPIEEDLDPEADLGDLEDDEELLLDEEDEDLPKKKLGAKKAKGGALEAVKASSKTKAKAPPKLPAKGGAPKGKAAAVKETPKKKPAKGKK